MRDSNGTEHVVVNTLPNTIGSPAPPGAVIKRMTSPRVISSSSSSSPRNASSSTPNHHLSTTNNHPNSNNNHDTTILSSYSKNWTYTLFLVMFGFTLMILVAIMVMDQSKHAMLLQQQQQQQQKDQELPHHESMLSANDNNQSNNNNNNNNNMAMIGTIDMTATHHHHEKNITTSSSTDSSTVKDNKSSILLPKIVWLMSFPNSGTSYTITNIGQVSNTSFATNYGMEVLKENANDVSSSIYGPEYIEYGPYYRFEDPHSKHHKELPSEYVITKTHCGGRCVRCRGAKEYQLSLDKYIEECTRGMGKVKRKPGIDSWKKSYYPTDWVYRAIHLIRNPYHNIISRFHLARKHYTQRLATVGKSQEFIDDWMEQAFPDNSTGFQKWCHELQTEFYDKHKGINKLRHEKLSCWFEFFKYTNWHNLAIQTIDKLSLEPLVIYYEDYEIQQWNATMTSLLNFLKLQPVHDIQATIQQHPFVARHDYETYFTNEQKDLASKYVQQFASNETWNFVQHYFLK